MLISKYRFQRIGIVFKFAFLGKFLAYDRIVREI